MATFEPFAVYVTDTELEQLKQKLSTAIFPDELEDAGWSYGAPLADVKRLTNYWKDGFDWRKVEARINDLPNFRTTIQADGFEPLKIHFLHQKSKVPGAIPLLFLHGWCVFPSTSVD
jgi:pimeloyl-ACP methyl ester carboxylesterase